MPFSPGNRAALHSAATADATLADAVEMVRRRCPRRPAAGIILGSGLGGLADEIRDPVRIDYADIPGFVRSTAAGHRGQLILGRLDATEVIVMAGRMHRYEGYRDDEVTFPVRLMAALGAKRLIVSNAAGGLNPLLEVGDIVVISDHIDLATRCVGTPAVDGVPLHDKGDGELTGVRGFVSCGRNHYDRELCQIALKAARAGDFPASPGIYLATLGPTYETRAEYRMMRFFGADVVGMSTAPEVQSAAALGMRVLGLSIVSNVAQPDAPHSTSHQEVLEAGRSAASKLRQIVAAALHPFAGSDHP